jgi:hypothetical protein
MPSVAVSFSRFFLHDLGVGFRVKGTGNRLLSSVAVSFSRVRIFLKGWCVLQV